MEGEDFGKQLQAYRQARRLTKTQLAERGGVTRRTLTYWESGEHTPRSQELAEIAEALGLTPEERQTLTALLPTAKAGKLIRATPAWADVAPPPGAGDLIRALRWRRRFSREQVADNLGVHRTTLMRWEESRSLPSSETLSRLCDVLLALPEEHAALLSADAAAPLWNGAAPTLDTFQEEVARLDSHILQEVDPLFDLRAHLLAGTLWNLASRHPEARPLLAQTYSAHARFACLRGDATAALDFSRRSTALIRQGDAPPEAVWYTTFWANCFAQNHHAPKGAARHNLQQAKQWFPQVRKPGVRACFLLSAAYWALQCNSLREAGDYWQAAKTIVNGISRPSFLLTASIQSTYADLLVAAGRYDEGLEAGLQAASSSYLTDITRHLFQTSVFLKTESRSEADGSLRRAYDLIATYQADLHQKEADRLAAQLERLA